jgi:metal-responsive CopG/Arc/MetJ family transcriptional regulator
VSKKKSWQHIHLNVPITLLEKFDKIRQTNRTEAIHKAMELYLEKEGSA